MKEIAKKLKDRLSEEGMQDIIVEMVESAFSQVKFANNKIVKIADERAIDIGVFVAKDQKIISTTLKDFTDVGIDQLVKQIKVFLKYVKPNTNYYGIAQGPFKYQDVPQIYDPKIAQAQPAKKVELTEQGILAALEEGATRVAGVLQLSEVKKYLITSGNIECEDRSTGAYFSIRALTNKEASGHATVSSTMLDGIDVRSAGHFAGRIAKRAKSPKSLPEGKYDIIFEPLAFAPILEHVGESASIFNVEAGFSFLARKLGKKIAPEKVTVIDDGRMPGGLASAKFDDEGYPTSKTIIIENGLLKTYLHNVSSARKYGVHSTGNAGLVAPVPTNVILNPGDCSRDSLFAQLKRGLYITNIWYTRFQDYVKGDFSTIPRDGAFYIENGEIKYPVKNLRISDNMLRILSNISLLGKELKQIYSWEVSTPVFCPLVLVKDVRITKPK